MKRKYNWKRQGRDERDYKAVKPVSHNYPPQYEVDTSDSPIFDQLDIGSCTANSAARVYHHLSKFDGSRLFLYYNERVEDGTVNEDAGSTIRQSVKSLNKQGICSERAMPYNTSKFAQKPSNLAFSEGLQHIITRYEAIPQTKDAICQAIYEGNCVLFGFDVYPAFESKKVEKTGRVPMPKKYETPIGGHAVNIVGYDTKKRVFKIVNSWGANWGDKGFFYLPFSYVLSTMCDDFWIIKL